MVTEMVIGHGRKGIQRVYDQHSYEDEMREALGFGPLAYANRYSAA